VCQWFTVKISMRDPPSLAGSASEARGDRLSSFLQTVKQHCTLSELACIGANDLLRKTQDELRSAEIRLFASRVVLKSEFKKEPEESDSAIVDNTNEANDDDANTTTNSSSSIINNNSVVKQCIEDEHVNDHAGAALDEHFDGQFDDLSDIDSDNDGYTADDESDDANDDTQQLQEQQKPLQQQQKQRQEQQLQRQEQQHQQQEQRERKLQLEQQKQKQEKQNQDQEQQNQGQEQQNQDQDQDQEEQNTTVHIAGRISDIKYDKDDVISEVYGAVEDTDDFDPRIDSSVDSYNDSVPVQLGKRPRSLASSQSRPPRKRRQSKMHRALAVRKQRRQARNRKSKNKAAKRRRRMRVR
ncbi:MAG: hypothetical protein MHM6MM_007039, partial [Cercozoa sp. M6MM]